MRKTLFTEEEREALREAKASKGFMELARKIADALPAKYGRRTVKDEGWAAIIYGRPWTITLKGQPSRAKLSIDLDPKEVELANMFRLQLGSIKMWTDAEDIAHIIKQLKPMLDKGMA